MCGLILVSGVSSLVTLVTITQYEGDEPPPIQRLNSPALDEGHRFTSRMLSEWASAENRFDHPSEAFYIATDGGRPVAMCGLNIDPFLSDGDVGRLRHLHVTQSHRRAGVASALVDACLTHAEAAFFRVRLRTRQGSKSVLRVDGVHRGRRTGCHSLRYRSPPITDWVGDVQLVGLFVAWLYLGIRTGECGRDVSDLEQQLVRYRNNCY